MTDEQLLATVSEFDVDVNGVVMPVIRFGSGKRVLSIVAGVSLSGLRGQGAGVAQAYRDFAEDFTVYLFDRRAGLPQGFTVQDMAEDVVNVLAKLGVTQTDVYGCSQGGMIGLCMAISHPQLVTRLALCSSQSRAHASMKAAAAKWVELARAKDVVAINRNFFELVYSQAYLDQFRELLPVLEKQGTAEDCARFEVLAYACGVFDVYDQLDRLRCPMLVMADRNDHVIDPESTVEIAEKTGCKMVMFTDYSHAVYDEYPQVKKLLLDFLNDDGVVEAK